MVYPLLTSEERKDGTFSSLSKEIRDNIDNKELFPVTTNGGTYDICYSSLDKSGKKSLLDVGKHGADIYLLIFIEQQF